MLPHAHTLRLQKLKEAIPFAYNYFFFFPTTYDTLSICVGGLDILLLVLLFDTNDTAFFLPLFYGVL